MRVATLALLALAASGSLMAEGTDYSPKLLLTSSRLRRLQRDRERQTVRWTDFENRVESVPDSPERGFELALYYAVTHDAQRGREAIQWAVSHPCKRRQIALILDWCADLVSDDQRKKWGQAGCAAVDGPMEHSRDELFEAVIRGGDVTDFLAKDWKDELLPILPEHVLRSNELYALCEYLDVARRTEREDLREDARQFFSNLPQEFLLSLKPEQIEHPDWMTHVAALALVNVDPNLEGSQYLQGWAMENGQTLHDGPGVAYEFLWADPYLPGVGYQNLDSWAYDASGRLFARTDWDINACWIFVSPAGIAEQNCPAGWQKSAKTFGHMTLTPVTASCIDAPQRKTVNDVNVFWKLAPHQTVYYLIEKQLGSMQADAAGMWRLPANVQGKVCTSPDTLKVPHAHK